jgi:hypothetical protein
MNTGKIVQVVGPVVDVEFPDALPGIYNALTVDYKVQNQPVKLTLEVQQHFVITGCGRLRPPPKVQTRLRSHRHRAPHLRLSGKG